MHTPYIVGIAGGSASGKSTFCTALEQALYDVRLRVFHMDHYFKPPLERPVAIAPVTGKAYSDYNHPDTVDLQRLHTEIGDAIG